ncbi:NAD(P)/FAD-dependent oxidoreductase [Castellaniella caeni]
MFLTMDACTQYDAAIIGGGFYGAAIAIYLAGQRGLKKLVLCEQEPALLARASYVNQARIHNGYHYPRSFTTAYRSRVNQPRFVAQWPEAVYRRFVKLYAVARHGSKVTGRQFYRFCREIGAPIRPATPSLRALFSERLIDGVFEVEESAFDSTALAAWAGRELGRLGVQIRLGTKVDAIRRQGDGLFQVLARPTAGGEALLTARYVFNCTYSGLNHFGGDFGGTRAQLKHELTEMALIEPPAALRDLGVTVMDGPFFSMMPFPARHLNTLSHVRYTPHQSWGDDPTVDPYRRLGEYERATRVERMIRDAARYVPAMRDARYVESMFEVKTVLVRNESDDGRPILFERSAALPGLYSILGGKIDNIFDVLEKLDDENL